MLSDQHTRSPYHRILIVILHFGFSLAFELSSPIRVDFLKMWSVSTRYAEIVRPLRVVLVVDVQTFQRQVALHFLENSDPGSCLQQRVSSQLRSSLHLFATLGNLTLRHFDLNLQLQAALAIRLKPCGLGALNIPGRFDAFELGAVEELAAVCKTRFNVGFDFATILSSPVKCCILFDIASGQLAKLKC